jgi:hypothetical protein
MDYKIIDDNNPNKLSRKFTNAITHGINNLFPNLISQDKDYLINSACELILVIAYKFSFISINPEHIQNAILGELFYTQLIQNDYQDIKVLVMMLLPHIDEDLENTKKISLTSFQELYTTKKPKENTNNLELKIFNNLAPEYTYCNIQYNRCVRKNKIFNKEINFDYSHLNDNKKLLFNTIQIISNKLFVNWMDITPVDLSTYMSDYDIYGDTYDAIINQNIDEWDLDIKSDGLKYQGICLQDIYQTFSFDLFTRMANSRWLIFDYLIHNRPVCNIFVLDYLLPLTRLCQEVEWFNLDEKEKSDFSYAWTELKNAAFVGITYKKINKNIVERVFKTIGIYFQKYYINIDKLIGNNLFSQFDVKTGEFDEEEDELADDADKGVTAKTIYRAFENTPAEDIYKFLYDNVKEISTMWYGLFLFKEEKYQNKTFNNIKKFNFINEEKLSDLDFDAIENNVSYEKMSDNTSKYGFFFYENGKFLTFKNIYNISKSLCHQTDFTKKNKDRVWIRNSNYWSELIDDGTRKQKTIFVDKIVKRYDPPSDWFRVSSYLKMTYGLDDFTEITEYNNWLFSTFQIMLTSVVFQNLISKGCFNYFLPNRELTDKKLVGPDDQYGKLVQQKMGQYMFNKSNKKKYGNGYYFITGKTYKSMTKIKMENGNYVSYFDHLMKDGAMTWPTNYAVNWVCQINFFHRYINNRVLYVTGATGQGKSTQMPKLLLYALKAIDFKSNGKVICTQPRKEPTSNNSIFIAKEMGLPIDQPSLILGKPVRTNNYYVQFKYQDTEDSHQPFDKNKINSFLRLVTDGLLFQQILKNPFLKKTRKNPDNPKTTLFSTENEFDIVMIDESHEHNANMDFILTMMRNVLVNNNSIKLVIVSATMEYDEPLYRRYYRDINDNKISPWNKKLSEFNLDRINVDRRLHLGAPGTTTKYKVYDEFLPAKNVLKGAPLGTAPTSGAIENMNDLIERVVKKTVEICKTHASGHMLIFMPGYGDIMKTINFLNENAGIGKDTTAIPFYGEMPTESRQMIINIDKYVSTFHYNKNDINWFLQEPDSFKEAKIKPDMSYSYKRAIIVSTNIAEASVTINGLKFMIDTGVTKIALYDGASRQDVLITKRIGETNRVQRRGRVGRRSEGYAYFMYDKNDTKTVDNMARLEMTRKELSMDLFSISEASEYSSYFRDYNEKIINKFYLDNSLNDPNTDEYKTLREDIRKIYIKHYCFSQPLDPKHYLHQYSGNSKHYDYDQCESISDIYSRIKKEDCVYIYDFLGNYFLVHPEEHNLYRDIVGNIIAANNVETLSVENNDNYDINFVVSNKITLYLSLLIEYLFIVPYDINDFVNFNALERLHLDKNLSADIKSRIDNNIIKYLDELKMRFGVTEFGVQITKLHKNIMTKDPLLTDKLSVSDFISYIWSRAYSKNNDIIISNDDEKKQNVINNNPESIDKQLLRCLVLLYSCDSNLMNLSFQKLNKKRKTEYAYDKFKMRYTSKISDFEILLNIIKLIDIASVEMKKMLYSDADIRNRNLLLFNIWQESIDKYEIPALKSNKEYNKLRQFESTSHDLSKDKQFLKYLDTDTRTEIIRNSLKKNWSDDTTRNNFIAWCEKNDLSVWALYKYMDRINKIEKAFNSVNDNELLFNKGFSYDEEIIDYKWVDEHVKINEKSDNKLFDIIKSFMRGYPYNVCTMNDKKLYKNIVNPSLLLSIKNAFFFNVPETGLTKVHDLLFYRNIIDNSNMKEQLEKLKYNMAGNVDTNVNQAESSIYILSRIKSEWIVEMNPHVHTLPIMTTRNYDYKLINSYKHQYINNLYDENDIIMRAYIKQFRRQNREIMEEYYNKTGGSFELNKTKTINKNLFITKTNNKLWPIKIIHDKNLWLLRISNNNVYVLGQNLVTEKINKKLNKVFKKIIYV